MDRASQPIYVMDSERLEKSERPLLTHLEVVGDFKNSTYFNNRINAYRDGPYLMQKRLQRFPAIVDHSKNYTIEYTGTPPFKQRFILHGRPGSSGMLVTIKYPDAGAYKVYDEFQELAIPTDWDHSIETWAVPTGRYCGENRFQGVVN